MYIFRLAWRYTLSRWFNLIAIIVMALTLMASLTVLGVIDGMLVDMERRMRDLGEQVALYFERPAPENLCREITALPAGIKGITPQVVDYALLSKSGLIAAEPAIAYGIDLAQEIKFSNLADFLEDEKINPQNPQWTNKPTKNLPPMFIGKFLAQNLSIDAGDTVIISYSPRGANELRKREFYVASIFNSGSPVKDGNGFYLPIAVAREMFLTPAEVAENAVTSLSFFFDNPDMVDENLEREITRAVINATKTSAHSITWKQRWRAIYEGMAYENMLMEVVLFFMNLMAGCSVFAVMATLVSSRVRDVGLLRCLGAHRLQTVGVFLLVGFFIGTAGTMLGVLSGYLVGYNINDLWKFFTGIDLYPPRMFGHIVEPIIYPTKVMIYAVCTIFISIISALYPAISAGCREPLDALRDE